MKKVMADHFDIRAALVIDGSVVMDSSLATIGTRLKYNTWKKPLTARWLDLVTTIEIKLENGHHISVMSSNQMQDKIDSVLYSPVSITGPSEESILCLEDVHGQSYIIYSWERDWGSSGHIIQEILDERG